MPVVSEDQLQSTFHMYQMMFELPFEAPCPLQFLQRMSTYVP